MRHSCSLGLTYRAARDVTDGHVWHCTNKQPVDCAANTHTHTLNPTRMWKHTAHRHISFQVCSCENPTLKTILYKPFAHLFHVYICNPWLLHSIHIIIYPIEEWHFWTTCVYVDKNVLCYWQSRAATTGRFINWMTDRKLAANYW